MIQDLSGSWCIQGTDESMIRVDSSVPLMHHDPDRSWITDPDPDHPIGTHSNLSMALEKLKFHKIMSMLQNNNWFMVGVHPSSYGCTW